MKIEKVNENQIRCTLTREDLASRELKISELAYGTEKAKNLFRDMMQQANYEFGFEAEDIPLMIEAIPLNAECIVLIITKVEDPEELDTRFSRFAPSAGDGEEDYDDSDDDVGDNAEEVMELFKRLHESRRAALEEMEALPRGGRRGGGKNDKHLTRIFLFDSLHPIITIAGLLAKNYKGNSFLYKDDSSGKYLLTLTPKNLNTEDFSRACSMVSEYGCIQKSLPSGTAYLEEHYQTILKKNALQALARI
ncbi:MAG: adaptor protein MecA [Clostridium sp.]|jgi:adapter protein MecA 1/2|nr:adaptor protein MecA [Clostridium sp.]